MRIVILIFSIILFSCCSRQTTPIKKDSSEWYEHDNGYTKQSKKYSSGSATTVSSDPSSNITLDNYLRKVPGVNVWNDGPNATITVRGVSSFNSGLTPLFIVNGNQVTGGFSSVYASVAPADIKSVTVLKDASSTAIYGTRGANGVIVITLKSASK
ncbi:MAG: TonB-dependent receptor plug domain-containing protein [Saprospiraceae bacterium]|nr:TonB-dependent receptor plug domain-containing protein [Saprospiraceae bacterium]